MKNLFFRFCEKALLILMSSSLTAESSKAVDHIIAAVMTAGAVPTSEEIVVVASLIYGATGILLTPDEVVQRMVSVQKAGVPGREAGRKWVDHAAALAVPLTSSMPQADVRGRGVAASSGPGGKEERIDRLLELLALCNAVDGADVFREPVCPRTIMEYNQSTLGPYNSTIRYPMSLSVIQAMIMDRRITSVAMLESRIWQIAANCVMFNAPEGTFPHLARQFATKCSQILRESKGAS